MLRQNYQIINKNKYDLSLFTEVENQIRLPLKTNSFFPLPEKWKVYKTSLQRADRPNTWSILKVEIEKDGEPYIDFIRNYPSLPLLYVEQNEEEFIITSTDYQCITIINLTTKEIKTYADVDDLKFGGGFCPISFDWDEDTLYVNGCIWGCPEETMIAREIDLNNPTEAFNKADWQSDYDDDSYCEDDDDEDWEDETENC